MGAMQWSCSVSDEAAGVHLGAFVADLAQPAGLNSCRSNAYQTCLQLGDCPFTGERGFHPVEEKGSRGSLTSLVVSACGRRVTESLGWQGVVGGWPAQPLRACLPEAWVGIC